MSSCIIGEILPVIGGCGRGVSDRKFSAYALVLRDAGFAGPQHGGYINT